MKAREKIRAPFFHMPESHSSDVNTFHAAIAKFKHESLITLSEDLATTQAILNSRQFIGSTSFYESRFGSLDQATHKVGQSTFQYLRVKNNPFSFSHSADFEKIIIIPNTEENMNLVILIPKDPALKMAEGTLRQIRQALQGIQVADEQEQTIKSIWVPQFKIAVPLYTDTSYQGLEVQPSLYVQTCQQ